MAFENPFRHFSKTQIYVIIAGGTAIGGVALWNRHSRTGSWNPFSSATADSGTVADNPITGMPYSQDDVTDPATGQEYLAEAEQYGSVAAAEAAVSAFGQSSATGSGIGVTPASGGTTGTTGTTGTGTPETGSVYTSNAAWAQAATAGLASVGYSETDVASALGAYLTGTPLTPDQAKLVRTAISEYDKPPVGNLQVILAPVATAPVMAKVPDVSGEPQEYAVQAITSEGLKPVITKETVKGQIYYVSSTVPAAGASVKKGTAVTIHAAPKPNLAKHAEG